MSMNGRTYGGALFTKGERRWLFLKRCVCMLRGHQDSYVEWWGAYTMRCRRCLTFALRG